MPYSNHIARIKDIPYPFEGERFANSFQLLSLDENLEIPEHTLLYLSDKFEVSVEKVMLDGNKSQEDASQVRTSKIEP